MPSGRTTRKVTEWRSGLPPTFGGTWACPVSGDDLHLVLAGNAANGVLSDAAGEVGRCWPVVDGVPYLRTDRPEVCSEVVDAIAAGRDEQARQLLFTQPRETDDLPNEMCDSGSVRTRLRAINKLVLRLQRLDRNLFASFESDAERRSIFEAAIDAFGFNREEIDAVRRVGAHTHGLAARGLLALHPPNIGVLVQSGCGLGEIVQHAVRHGLVVVGCDSDWTSLWIARQLLGCWTPLACVERRRESLPINFATATPVTHLLSPAAGIDAVSRSTAQRWIDAVGPRGRVLVASVPSEGVPLGDAVPDRPMASRADLEKPPRPGVDASEDASELNATPSHGEGRSVRESMGDRSAGDDPVRCELLIFDRDHFIRSTSEFRQPDPIDSSELPPLCDGATAAATEGRTGEEDTTVVKTTAEDGRGLSESTCYTWVMTADRIHRAPHWELMLPPEGTPLRVNPVWKQWRTERDADEPSPADEQPRAEKQPPAEKQPMAEKRPPAEETSTPDGPRGESDEDTVIEYRDAASEASDCDACGDASGDASAESDSATTADLLGWSEIDPDWPQAVLDRVQPRWSAKDAEVVELVRTHVLVADE